MALYTLKCNHLTPVRFKGLTQSHEQSSCLWTWHRLIDESKTSSESRLKKVQ